MIEQNIDFEVDFNPTVSVNSPKQSASTQSQLDGILCNLASQTAAPSSSNLVTYLQQAYLEVLAGVSIDNFSILNVNSADNVDPFYPPSGYTAEMVDSCLAHP